MCIGNRINGGVQPTLNDCTMSCTNVAPMFIYARKGSTSCGSNGCRCYCEKSATADGTCELESNYAYNLYRIIAKG